MSYRIRVIQGVASPIILCDYCWRRIENGRDGNMLFPERFGGVGSHDCEPRHTHKACNQAFETKNKSDGKTWSWSFHELDQDLSMLCKNAGHDAKRGKRLADTVPSLDPTLPENVIPSDSTHLEVSTAMKLIGLPEVMMDAADQVSCDEGILILATARKLIEAVARSMWVCFVCDELPTKAEAEKSLRKIVQDEHGDE